MEEIGFASLLAEEDISVNLLSEIEWFELGDEILLCYIFPIEIYFRFHEYKKLWLFTNPLFGSVHEWFAVYSV